MIRFPLISDDQPHDSEFTYSLIFQVYTVRLVLSSRLSLSNYTSGCSPPQAVHASCYPPTSGVGSQRLRGVYKKMIAPFISHFISFPAQCIHDICTKKVHPVVRKTSNASMPRRLPSLLTRPPTVNKNRCLTLTTCHCFSSSRNTSWSGNSFVGWNKRE